MSLIKIIIAAFVLSSFASANFSTTTPTKNVDILILVDNSGSMQDNQREFASRIDSILAPYANNSLNIGLITSDDMMNPVFVGTAVNGPFNKVVEQLKKDIDRVGTNGSATEQYMTQILRTFKENAIFNFHRPNTELQVFIVTDEDEQTMTAKQFVSEVVAYKSFDKIFINVFAPKCKTAGNVDWENSELFFLSTITSGFQRDLCLNNPQ